MAETASGGVALESAGPRRLFAEPLATNGTTDSPSASNSSTTPQTDNRDAENVKEESPATLPESTQQPILLETIGNPPPPVAAPRPFAPAVDPRVAGRSPSKSERRRRRKKALSDLGPVVYDYAYEEAAATQPQFSANGVDARDRSVSERSYMQRHHRRTGSGEYYYPPSEDPYYGQVPVGAMPHPQMLPTARHQEYMMQQQAMFQGSPPPQARHGRRRHHRVRSNPDVPLPDPYGYWTGQGPPQALSPSGNPLIPILNQEGMPMEGLPPDTGSRRKRKQQYSRVRASSASGAMQTMYGAVSEYGAPPPPPMTPERGSPRTQQQQQQQSQNFSPRGEFMSLANAFSPQKAANRSYDSASPLRGRMTPPLSPAQTYNRVSPQAAMAGMSPRISPQTPSSALRKGPYPAEDGRGVTFSPGTPRHVGFYDDGGGIPEDYISSAKKASKKGRSAHSIRRMNMRQQSAQLFMEDSKGTGQPKACRDVLFALLFVLHLAGMAYLGATYGHDALSVNPDTIDDDDDPLHVTVAYKNVITVAVACGLFAVTVSALVFWLMSLFARRMVQVALILTIALSFCWGTVGIGLSPKNIVPITGIIALALSVGYTFVVWDRIPFATANLLTALSAIGENAGTVLISFFFQGLALGWSIYYTFVVVGVYDAMENGELVLGRHMTQFVYTMLGISYYWTFHVLLNIVQVAVAGTIGCWWFKDKSTFCDGTPARNVLYALTLSFGSICFGSLLVGPVRLLRQISLFFRPSPNEDSVLMCLHECLSCIQNCIASVTDNLASCFNPFAFTYVGLYGYGLLDAGQNATALFEKRGWTMIVADDLIPNILLMVSLVIGGCTGCFGFLIEDLEGLNFVNGDKAAFEGATAKAFAIGLAVGLVLTSVLFGIISSSVNAVLVCFAGSPVEFERFHPELSHEMRSAWREVWPGCMNVVDMKVAYSQGQNEVENETTPLV